MACLSNWCLPLGKRAIAQSPPVCSGICATALFVLADKAYDADWLRRRIEAAGAAPNIPAMVHRRWKPCFSPVLYRARNRIELDAWKRFDKILGRCGLDPCNQHALATRGDASGDLPNLLRRFPCPINDFWEALPERPVMIDRREIERLDWFRGEGV